MSGDIKPGTCGCGKYPVFMRGAAVLDRREDGQGVLHTERRCGPARMVKVAGGYQPLFVDELHRATGATDATD